MVKPVKPIDKTPGRPVDPRENPVEPMAPADLRTPVTKGQKRVSNGQGPHLIHEVNMFREMNSQAIDILDEWVEKGGEIARCAAIAQTKLEEATMWAIKAFTKPEDEPIDE